MAGSPFRVSVSSASLLRLERSQAIQFACDAGFEAIELACQEPHLTLETARRDRTLVQLELRMQFLKLASFSLGTRFTSRDAANYSSNALMEFINIAHTYGTSVITLTTGPPTSAEATFEHWETLLEYLTPCVARAEKRDIKLAIETRRGMLTDSVHGALRLLDRFDNPALGLALDPCELALGGDDVESAVTQLGSRTVLFRARNLASLNDAEHPQWLPLGDGTLPYPVLMRLLLAAGYQGDLVASGLYDGKGSSDLESLQADASYLKRLVACYA